MLQLKYREGENGACVDPKCVFSIGNNTHCTTCKLGVCLFFFYTTVNLHISVNVRLLKQWKVNRPTWCHRGKKKNMSLPFTVSNEYTHNTLHLVVSCFLFLIGFQITMEEMSSFVMFSFVKLFFAPLLKHRDCCSASQDWQYSYVVIRRRCLNRFELFYLFPDTPLNLIYLIEIYFCAKKQDNLDLD